MSKANACGTSPVTSQPPTTCTTNISHGRCRDVLFITLVTLEGDTNTNCGLLCFCVDSNHFNESRRMGRDSRFRLPSCKFLWKTTQILAQDEVTLLEPVAAIHRPWFI